MKFRKLSQSILAVVGSAGFALGLTSCGTSNTVDYLYVTSSKNNPGQINAYRVDSQSGALTQIPDSPYSSLGRNPMGIAASPIGYGSKNTKYLYVVNHDDNTIVTFGIGTDAKLYAGNSYNTPGSEPVAVAVNPAGNLLFVVDFYQPTFTDLNPGPGAVVVYPINQTDGSLGTPITQPLSNGQSYYSIGNAPAGVNVLANGNYVYVTDQLLAGKPGCTTAGQGSLEAFGVGTDGTLTPVAGSPFCAGTTPSAVASSPLNNYVYVTDSSQNQVTGFSIGNTGVLTSLVGGPVATGTGPDGIVIEPRGLYMYVSNRISNTVQSYSISSQTGIPASSGSAGTDTFPGCVIVDPALSRFVYTANFEGGDVSGFQLNPNTGILTVTQGSPYNASGLSNCAAAVVHGNHPTITVQPTAG